MTNAQKRAEAERIRNVRNMQAWSLVVLFVGLIASVTANVMQSWDEGPVGWVINGWAPLFLFIGMFLFELMGKNVPLAKRILSWIVLGATALIAGIASYDHIHGLILATTHNVLFSWILPATVDLPMILASVTFSEARKALATPKVPTTPVRRSATRTEAVRGTVVKPSRTRTAKVKKETDIKDIQQLLEPIGSLA